ncbi:hypothetical protein [Streptomyces corynorhini]|uniref:Uncharacterized protein n=1 Tax=Streptomyces corynorhini TaxID=2282652 RepID=A0A370B8X1_9ACTN|nr:hypothetical protein [Streptomyces corynorhini]RDG36819.1 hypothetical protein DVH02_17835 [Streptomyces corynorhini]
MTDVDTRWSARLRLALADRSVGHRTADVVLDEVAQHCAATGETPEEAFGPAEEYAAVVVQERIPPEDRAGSTGTHAEHVGAALMAIGCVLLLAGPVLWIVEGAMLPVTLAGLVGVVLVVLAATGGNVTFTLSGSRVRAAVGWGVATAVLVVLAAVAFTTLPATDLGRIPALTLSVLGIPLFYWGLKHGSDSAADTAKAARAGTGTDAGTGTGTEGWLRELTRQLKEEHGIRAARAAELTAEAAEHLRATGARPEEEFGPVGPYAVRLADEDATPHERWWLRDGVRSSALTLAVTVGLTWSAFSAGLPVWQLAVGCAAIAVEVAILVSSLVSHWRSASSRA